MDHLLFETRQPAQLTSIPELRNLLTQVAHKSVPQQTVRRRIMLCLSESVTNLVQYAMLAKYTKLSSSNKCDDYIGLRFGHNNIGWWLEIIDPGLSWDPTNQPYVDIGDTRSTFTMNENGRGIALLHNQCDQLDYQKGEESEPNKLRMTWFSKKTNQRPCVLLVEDDLVMSRLYTAYLHDNFDVEVASNGLEALTLITNKKFDLVLSDICMPQMNGLNLRERLNNKAELIPFIFITAANNLEIRQQATQLGVDDYVEKPVQKAQLIHIIKRVLERSSQVRQNLNERIEKKISSSLIPSLPNTSHNWNMRVAYRNTGLGGGDFLLHQHSKNHLMLMLVDIMGHDDSAKFFAFAYAGYLRGLVQTAGSELSPSELLERLSEDALQDKLLSQILLTCCAVTLATGGQFTIACAGHPPPLLITSTGVQVLAISGTLPGLIHKTHYQHLSQKLAEGERLALYTDGLFESANTIDERLQLENNIMQTLVNTLDRPIEDSLEITMHMFDQIAGSPPKDDALLILLENSQYK